MDFAHYLNQFIDESREAIQQLNDQVLRLERDPQDVELLHALFRTIHTFKGMASTMGFDDLAELAHRMESLLEALRSGAIAPDAALVDVLLQGVEQLERLIAGIGSDDAAPAATQAVLTALELALSRSAVVQASPALAGPAPRQEAPAPERPLVSENAPTFRVVVTLEALCMLKGVRAMLIVSSLETLGEVLDITPSLEELEWAEDALAFEIMLRTDGPASAIEASFRDVGEVEAVLVTELAPESALGELSEDAPPLMLDDAQRQQLQAAMGVGFQAVRVEVTLMPASLMKGVRAAMVMQSLVPFGEVLRLDPPINELDQDAGDRFWVVAQCVCTPSAIRDALAGIGEVLAVAVQLLTPSQVATASTPVTMLASEPEPPEEAPVEPAFTRRPQTVRVPSEQLDALLGLVNELAADHGRLEHLMTSYGLDQVSEIGEVMRHLGQLATQVQSNVRDLRMVPIEAAFNRFPRMIRNLNRELGKEAELTLEGQDTQLDRLVVDELGEPLMHLLRNALDHGLETPEERLKAGKPAGGRLRLAAFEDEGHVVITVSDDGRGMDPGRIRAKAIARGLVSAEGAEALPSDRIIDFIFTPGFSTAEAITAISGRGVGLDVVRNKIASLGGTVEVDSLMGQGTTFRVRLPLSTRLVQAMLTGVGDEIYAIPMGYVEEVFALADLGANPLPLVKLRDRLDVASAPSDGPLSVVVVRTPTQRVGLVVEQLLGKHEIAIKSLGRLFDQSGYLTGAAPLDDGRMALILDPTQLLQEASASR